MSEGLDLDGAVLELARRLGLAPEELQSLGAELESVVQDRVIPRSPSGEGRYLWVLRGKIAFAEFEPGTVPEPPKNAKKRITPTMQVCERVVALFEEDDVLADDHAEFGKSELGVRRELALFTAMNVVALAVPRAAMDALLEANPIAKARLQGWTDAALDRQLVLQMDGRAQLLDFYVKQGLEYAHEIKVIQTDKCIDCDECVLACEERHGISRIERFGPRVGLLQFTENCRSCHDARCIQVCNFDAISYDEGPHPEVVVYDNCVGCTKCAKSCPHDAIQMVDLPEVDIVELASKPKTMVAPGEEAAKPKKKAKRVANKCDHCLGYDDMACISACPTGAIIQISPRELFRSDRGEPERVERYFETSPFELGWAQARKGDGVRSMHALFALTAVGVALVFWTYLARRVGASMGPDQLLGWTPAPLTPVAGLLRWLGYAGAVMMVISAGYTTRLHIPGLRRLGGARAWFDLHVVFGLAGPALSLLHTDFHVFDLLARPLVVSLWWSVFLVVVSGLVGRFFYTAMPRLEAASARQKLELERGIDALADAWSAHTMSANLLAQFQKAQAKVGAAAERVDALSLGSALAELLRLQLGRWSARRGKSPFRGLANQELRSEALALVEARAALERRAAAHAVTKRLLSVWRVAHIGLTVLMFGLLAAHASIAIYATGW